MPPADYIAPLHGCAVGLFYMSNSRSEKATSIMFVKVV